MSTTATATTTSSSEAEEFDPQERYRSWPALSWYYTLGWDEIRRMPRWLRRIYVEELPKLKAEAKSEAIDVSTFPHMKRQSQERITRRINRLIGPKPKSLSKASPAEASALPIGVKFVPNPEGGDD
jgi:hypothetical protein